MAVPAMNGTTECVLPDNEGPEARPQNRRSFSMMIARSIIDGVGSAPNVARRHLHRGQFRIPEPMRSEMQSRSRVVGGERCFPPFAKFVPYRKSCAHTQARQPSNPHSV